MRNMFVLRSGGASNRQGSGFINEIKDSANRAYFLKFVFNEEQSYVLEVGALITQPSEDYIRIYQNGVRLSAAGAPEIGRAHV